MTKKSLNEIEKWIKDEVNKILTESGQTPEQAKTAEKGRAFTEFYIKEIARYLDNITDEKLVEDGLECDRRSDIGLDFIYAKDDNDFWICQSKYVGRDGSLSEGTITAFFGLHERIFDKESRRKSNKNVQELLPPIGNNSYITFVLLTNGKASDTNREEFDRLRKKAEKDKNAENYAWRLVDLHQIKEDYLNVISSDGKYPKVSIPIPGGKEGYIDLSHKIFQEGKNYKTFVTVINGNILKDLCGRYRDSLFHHNIRGFLGTKGKNRKIRETLETEPELFYLYNNGISATCTELNIDDSDSKGKGVKLLCKDFSIINGAQTACSIRSFSDTDNLKKVNILIRITQTEILKKSKKGLNRNIVEYNNTQNNIKDADFRSNDDVQVMLENEISRGKYLYKIGKNPGVLSYMRKRADTKGSRKKHIGIEKMARALYAFNFAFLGGEEQRFDLHPASKVLFDIDGLYTKLFGAADEMSKTKVKEFAAIAMLDTYLNERIKLESNAYKKGVKDKTIEEDNSMEMTYRSGHFLRSFGYILRTFYPESKEKILKKIADGDFLEEGKFVSVLYEKVKDRISLAVTMELERDDFNFRDWQRNYKHVTVLMKGLKTLGKELPKI